MLNDNSVCFINGAEDEQIDRGIVRKKASYDVNTHETT